MRSQNSQYAFRTTEVVFRLWIPEQKLLLRFRRKLTRSLCRQYKTVVPERIWKRGTRLAKAPKFFCHALPLFWL